MNSKDVRRRWAKRSGEFSPEYYAQRGPDRTSEAIGELFERHLDRESPILEVGCSSGRHLAYLQAKEFRNLVGIELNAEAIAVMERTYPDLAAAGTIHVDAIENVLGGFADDRFDAVYSVETLQHIHPDSEPVFAELARITDRLLVTVENEGRETTDGVRYVDDGVPLYHRNWDRVFTDLGLIEIDANVQPGPRDTLRAFRPAEAKE